MTRIYSFLQKYQNILASLFMIACPRFAYLAMEMGVILLAIAAIINMAFLCEVFVTHHLDAVRSSLPFLFGFQEMVRNMPFHVIKLKMRKTFRNAAQTFITERFGYIAISVSRLC